MARPKDEPYSEADAAKRRDNALRRALSTPPKHKPSEKKKKSLQKSGHVGK